MLFVIVARGVFRTDACRMAGSYFPSNGALLSDAARKSVSVAHRLDKKKPFDGIHSYRERKEEK